MTTDQNLLKKQAAEAALDFIEPGEIIGVGTGSTVNFFIDALADRKNDIDAAVSSSESSTKRLEALGIRVVDLNYAGPFSVYVDGADEATEHGHLIKGGGGALTREKIIAAAAETFVCIIDESKLVGVLGDFPLPVEVIPMARSQVARQLVELGGQPVWREGFVTDNGNPILDVHNLDLKNPVDMERQINQIVGVVTVGLFAQRGADCLINATAGGVQTIRPNKNGSAA